MTMATSVVAGVDRSSRWILLGSLALNLFFIGATGALVTRHYLADRAVSTAPVDRSVAARVERLAATLPSSDAEILRSEYRANATPVDASRAAYHRAQDEVRRVLRSDPFEPEAMRAAMVKARAARQVFDQLLQDMIASAAGKMSAAGRNKLADWPPGPRSVSQTQR
ncbi:MAG TPA: periplasmic heavy metal sensor [Xanthobacteraceae bacterium]|nr:periplasmic heavy metal sensor [Xanthobacteraceae bacterium]